MVRDQPRRTKIVATIGPASGTEEGVRALVESGMDAARLNLSHGSREEHAENARLVRLLLGLVRKPLSRLLLGLHPAKGRGVVRHMPTQFLSHRSGTI